MESAKVEQSHLLVGGALLAQAFVAIVGGGLIGWAFPIYDSMLFVLFSFCFVAFGITALFFSIRRLWRNGFQDTGACVALFALIFTQPVLYFGAIYSVRLFDRMGDVSRFESSFVRYSNIIKSLNLKRWKQGHYYVALNDGGVQMDVTDATRVELEWFGYFGVWESFIYDPTDRLERINGQSKGEGKDAATMPWGDYQLTYCKQMQDHYYYCDLD
jgi:hypothetical protein